MAKKKLYGDGHEYYTNPVRAIRQLCIECNDSPKFSKKYDDCTAGQESTTCPVFPFRFGKNPFYKRILTDEQKDAIAARFKEAK